MPADVRVTVRVDSQEEGAQAAEGGAGAGEGEGGEALPPYSGTAVSPNTPREQVWRHPARPTLGHEPLC